MNNFSIFKKSITDFVIKDVFDLRSDSKASIYTPFTELSLSPTNLNSSPLRQAYNRSNSLSGKHKKLPPLSNSAGGSINRESNLEIFDLNRNNFNNLSSLLNLRNLQSPDLASSTSNFPDTENKKRPPQKIQSIGFNSNNKINAKNFVDSTVTIDILSESGRYSRQSLDPINYSEKSKYPSRPNSVKEPLFQKTSGKLKNRSKMSYPTKPLEEPLNITSYNNSREEDHDKEDDEEEYLNVESCYDDVEPKKTNENFSTLEADSHLTVSKLDTIDESINELMQANIRKLNLNEKPEVVPRNLLKINKPNCIKPITPNRPVSKLSSAKKQSIPKETLRSPNNKMITETKAKPIITITTAKQTITNKTVLNSSKCSSYRSKSIEHNQMKPILNLDLYNPTAVKFKNCPINNPSTVIKQPQQQIVLNKISSNLNSKLQINVPTQIETARIKKSSNNSVLSTLNHTEQSPPIIKVEYLPPTPVIQIEADNSTPKRQISDDIINEINSIMDLNVTNRSNVSSAATTRTALSNRSSRFEHSLASSSVGQPSQPVIALMFEDLPQPFTSKQNNHNIDLTKNKKQKIVSYSKKTTNNNNQRGRTASANTRVTKPKVAIKTNALKNKSTLEPNIEMQIKNEISMYIDSDLNKNYPPDFDYLSENENRLNVSNADLAKSEPDLHSKSLSQSQSQVDLNEYSIKLKSDLVRSVAEKVEAIYNKYNELINKQENIIIDNQKSLEQQTKELNEQKAHFSEEMADELEKNINFEGVSSDPELLKRLREVYAQVKQNISSVTKNETIEETITVNASPDSTLTSTPSIKLPSENNSLTHLDSNLKRTNSIRSNADIREVFQIVNGLSRNNSVNNVINRDLEMTFPPANFHRAKVILSNKNIYQIPTNLSDKINTLITTFQNNSIDEKKETEVKTIPEEITIEKQDSKLKFNYLNSLDSTGNESNNSIGSDSNSLSYHYDVKYRNDGSKSPVNLFLESENEFQFKWKRGNLIGKGAFGSVYQAMLSTGAIIAVKQIEMEETDPNKARKEYDNVREEVKILRELDHINIVQFMGTMLEGNTVNIFMELIPGGTIEFLLKTYGPFEESLFRNFTNQILEGINYIHSRNVVHRDIKGKNIMLMGNGIIKLIDFGCAKRLKKNQSSNSIKQLLRSLKGTPYWMSPEVIREIGHGSKADIWSTGATVFEMSTGSPPWAEYQPIAAIYRIGSGDTPIPELPSKFSPEARDFVSKCLIRNPDERPSAYELLQHDFLKQNIQA